MEECLSPYDREVERLKYNFQQWKVDESFVVPSNVSFVEDINKALEIIDCGLDLSIGPENDVLELNEAEQDNWFGAESFDVPLDEDLEKVDVSNIVRSFKEPVKLPTAISTKTFDRPKKARSSLGNILTPPPAEIQSPKLRRRLTTTIDPSPALIPHLQKLSRTNNRPLSNQDDFNWEDGAMEGEALAEAITTTPKRPVVPANLLQRLQELKATNNVRSPVGVATRSPFASPSSHRFSMPIIPAMSASQLMRDIPDSDSTEPESFLSLGDTSLILAEDGDLAHLKCFMGKDGEFDPRMTFGGINVPKGRSLNECEKTFVMVDQLVELNSTFTKDNELDLLHITNSEFDCGNGDENMNNKVEELFNGFSSELIDSTFAKNKGIQLEMFQTKANGTFTKLEESFTKEHTFIHAHDEVKANQTFTHFSPNGTFNKKKESTFTQIHEEKLTKENTFTHGDIFEENIVKKENTFTQVDNFEENIVKKDNTFTQADIFEEKIVKKENTFTQADIFEEKIVKKENTFTHEFEERSKVVQSNENLLEEPYQYSTATYSRPVARLPATPRSSLPMPKMGNTSLHRLSTEDLNKSRSPARSDGRSTPVEYRSGLGTYTRNSPVERNTSEDEQMSTASDHSLRSHDSVEDIPDRCRKLFGARPISTPVASGTNSRGLEEWQMSPISRASSSPRASTERLNGPARTIYKMEGPAPLKPTLIRPTDNFKRPAMKTTDGRTAVATPRVPVKPQAIKPTGGLPKPGSKGLPSRIPAGRLSSIPRPPSSRPKASAP